MKERETQIPVKYKDDVFMGFGNGNLLQKSALKWGIGMVWGRNKVHFLVLIQEG